MNDTVAIVGATGALGFGLALRFGRAGLSVVIGSRDAGRAAEAAGRARATLPGLAIEGRQNDEAIRGAEVVFLCVPFRSQAETIVGAKDALADTRLLVDASVPLATALGGRPTQMAGVWAGSAAEQAQHLVPAHVTVVSALHTVSAATLSDLDRPLTEDVLLCGRRRDDKREVARIIERVDGLRCVDAGPLEQARLVEPLTALLIGLNGRYRTHAGIRITGLPESDLFPPLRRPGG